MQHESRPDGALRAFDLSGKTAVVTGSGYGLGKQMALGLASAGCDVVVSGRKKPHLDETVERIQQAGGNAIAWPFDATDQQSCRQLIETAVRFSGRIDIAVINHGVIVNATPETTAQDEWNRVVNVNLTGCFYCAQAAGAQMIKQGSGGSIVMISSNGSLVGFDGLTAYGASKGGVDQLCRQLASEWGRHHIRVNTVNPGYTTNVMAQTDGTVDQAVEQEIKRLTPLARRGDPSELVGPVVFLASDAASFVTGHCLTVDGGYCIR